MLALVLAFVVAAAPAGSDPLTWPRPATIVAPVGCDFTVDDCKQRCAKGEQTSCYRLGRLHSVGFLVADDAALALRLFTSACAARVGDACNAVAATIRDTGDLAGAVVVFEKACALGSAKGCVNGGLLRDRWRGVTDAVRARELFERGCVLDQPLTASACVELGVLRRASGDVVGAATSWTRACARGEPRSCTLLASLPAASPVVRPDRAALRAIAERDCEAGDGSACVTVAAQMNNDAIAAAKGGGVVDQRARRWFDLGCALGAPEACMHLAARLADGGDGHPRDLPVAAAAARVACVEGQRLNNKLAARGCRQYADRLDRGEGVAKDEAAAVALYIDTCERAPPMGCDEAGSALLAGRTIPVDRPRALALLDAGCRRGDKPSCAALKQAGVDVGAIAEAAGVQTLIEQRAHCERGIAGSCAWVGQQLAMQGTGQPGEALAYLQRACAAGTGEACRSIVTFQQRLKLSTDVVEEARQRACALGLQQLCAPAKAKP